MGTLELTRANALFGVFLQDVKSIEKKYPKYFKGKYIRFRYFEIGEGQFTLSIDREDIPRKIKSEIMKAFDQRLHE